MPYMRTTLNQSSSPIIMDRVREVQRLYERGEVSGIVASTAINHIERGGTVHDIETIHWIPDPEAIRDLNTMPGNIMRSPEEIARIRAVRYAATYNSAPMYAQQQQEIHDKIVSGILGLGGADGDGPLRNAEQDARIEKERQEHEEELRKAQGIRPTRKFEFDQGE